MEPTKHQYDFDTATCTASLTTASRRVPGQHQANHATLASHSFHHEETRHRQRRLRRHHVKRRRPERLGHHRFPNSVQELSLAVYEIPRGGGFRPGASTSTPSCAARAWRDDPSTPASGHRYLGAPAPGGAEAPGRGLGGSARGPLRRLGRRSVPRCWAATSPPVRIPPGRGGRRITSRSRPAGDAGGPGQPAHLGRRPRRDGLTTGIR
jgi:hypothetical protein